MAPVRSALCGPLIRRCHACIERAAKIVQPFCRDRSMEQGITVSMKLVAVDHGVIDSVQGFFAREKNRFL
jgi:hypothetical protein